MRKILLTTLGSYGDLHPYIAMARVFKNHGDQVTIATHAEYQEQVERIGVQFVPMKPGLGELGPQENWSAKANHPVFGTKFIICTLVLPYVEESYHAIKRAADGQDLIISHLLCFAAPLVADELGIPWISTALQPSVFLSAYDPPALGFLTVLPNLTILGPTVMRWILRTLALPTRPWLKPLDNLRMKLGLPATSKNQLVDGYSPHGTLALFSSVIGPPQPDWPEKTYQIGFPLFDEETTSELSGPLTSFLDCGIAPVVFTLGTAIVYLSTAYFEIAYQAVKSLGLRAVFLVGKVPARVPPAALTDPQILVSPYEPFSKLFPHAAANVHQCGVGTTSQALSAGRPQVLVPFAHDQPDNARRVVNLGCGISIPAKHLSPERLIKGLKTVTTSTAIALRAADIAEQIRRDHFETQLLQALNEIDQG